MSNQLEHTFEVAVPVERAWLAFTDSAECSKWTAPEYEIDPRPGGKVRWTIPPWPTVDGEVLEVEPHQRLVYREGKGVLDGATRVTVTFESTDTGTRITVVQAGFGDGADWQSQLESHWHGWLWSFRDLVLYLETGVASERFYTRWRCDFGMSTTQTFTGMRVTGVLAGGWAEEAGLQVDDLILYLDDQPIFERTAMWPFQTHRNPGDRLEVEVARAGGRVRSSGVLRPIGA
jgi:uncharacterized protein YndB with AHSA1/START domain